MGRNDFKRATMEILTTGDPGAHCEPEEALVFTAAGAEDGEADELTEEAARHFKELMAAAVFEYFDELRSLRKKGESVPPECVEIIRNELEEGDAEEVLAMARIVKKMKRAARALANPETRAAIMREAGAEMEEPTLPDVLGFLGFEKAAQIYRQMNPNRTIAAAEAAEALTRIEGDFLAIPTLKNYENALSFHKGEQSRAFLMDPLLEDIELKFNKGQLQIGGHLRAVSEMELQNLTTRERIKDIDLPLLKVIYTVMLKDYERSGAKGTLKDAYTVYIPELLTYMGYTQQTNAAAVERLKRGIESFHNVVGVHYGKAGRISRYAVLVFLRDNEESNTITFASPYLQHVIKAIMEEAIRHDEAGGKKRKKDGSFLRRANNAYEIRASVMRKAGRNAAAFENVVIIASRVKRGGAGTDYSISIKGLQEHNPYFKTEGKDWKRARRRIIAKTLELLREETAISVTHIIPDPDEWVVNCIDATGKIELEARKPSKKTLEGRENGGKKKG